ncbi:MAG: type II toxin-antitoxin system PemK/MazF family toxin, partial [Verrucomicrobia bacterium]|nr:type II toxin-antitoxin system PemK/MazF family toxin [Verrucomicrobiota bacterium]
LPVVNVLPLTVRKPGRRVYPNEILLPVGTAGLDYESIVLCYQIRTLDKMRLGKHVGAIDDNSLQSGRRLRAWTAETDRAAASVRLLWLVMKFQLVPIGLTSHVRSLGTIHHESYLYLRACHISNPLCSAGCHGDRLHCLFVRLGPQQSGQPIAHRRYPHSWARRRCLRQSRSCCGPRSWVACCSNR